MAAFGPTSNNAIITHSITQTAKHSQHPCWLAPVMTWPGCPGDASSPAPSLQEKGEQVRAAMSEEGHYAMLDAIGLLSRASPQDRPAGASQLVNVCIAQVRLGSVSASMLQS